MGQAQMAEVQITDYLSKLFHAHGVACVVHNDWVVPNSKLPALQGRWYPNESNGVLGVQVLVRDKLVIEEAFAGVGQGDTGLHDALVNFTVNSFHVLLAAFWGKNDPQQVTTEEWVVGGKGYTAYIGNFGTRCSDGVAAQVPNDLFGAIEAAIKGEPLGEELHWFRLFVGNVENDLTFEALKDNEDWPAGRRCLEAAAWERNGGYYSVRLFAVLRR
jgi:hypothetical protein